MTPPRGEDLHRRPLTSTLGPRLHPRFQPQKRPAPSQSEATTVITFLHARMQSLTQDSDGGQALIASRLLSPQGMLQRYEQAVRYAAHAPYGLEHAWELVAATLATEVADLAAAWPEHPEYDPTWIR